jgi:hypothetical protein
MHTKSNQKDLLTKISKNKSKLLQAKVGKKNLTKKSKKPYKEK